VLAFILISTFPGWEEEQDEITGSEIDVMPFPARSKVHFSLLLTFFASMFALIGTIWQHTSAVTAATLLEASTSGAIKGHVGAAATAFAWIGTVFFFIALAGIVIMRISMAILESLVGDDGDQEEVDENSN
jgi:hypothetical protein